MRSEVNLDLGNGGLATRTQSLVSTGPRIRPLSIASTSSTSTTSSSHQKHLSNSYLASAESLQDGTFSPISDDEGESGDRLRYTDNVVHEVLETERAYVHDLGVVIQGYQTPMRENGLSEGYVSESDLTVLFGNLGEILKFHTVFLERLTSECSRRLLTLSSEIRRANGGHAVAIADCFLEQFGEGQGVEVYAKYCTNYSKSLQVLSRLVRPDTRSCALLSKLQLSLGHRMQLGSYLLKPVQRILKYPLLLDALRHFEKDYPGCAGQETIERALRTMQKIANRINEIKKLDEDAVRVQEIQSVLQGWPGDDLTTYGGLVAEEKVTYQKKHLMHIFLFEKMLLITKRKRKSPNLLFYAQHIATNDLMVNENRVTVGDSSFQVLSKSNRTIVYLFETSGRDRKKFWCDRLNRIILDSLNISPEQRSKILENLRIQRNLNYKQQNSTAVKSHKKATRGLDSIKYKANEILHRRRASVDSNIKATPLPPSQVATEKKRVASSFKVVRNEDSLPKTRPRHFTHFEVQTSLRSDETFRRCRSYVDVTVEEKPLRCSSLPRSLKLKDCKITTRDEERKAKPNACHEAQSKNRHWKHLLFTMGSRLRTSFISTDSGNSTPSMSESCRPLSLDSSLFFTNSEDTDDEEAELESNNSSGSFFERNFEHCCRDEIFRDSAIFSEDGISEVSAELRDEDHLHARSHRALDELEEESAEVNG